MGSMWDIGRKELEDSFSSRRFIAVIGLFVILSLASVYMGVQNYQQQVDNFGGGGIYGSAPELPTLIDIFTPLFNFNMPLTAGILGLLLSYDYISREREEGTIELLLSYPLYRDEIINGKLVSGIFTVALSLLAAFTISSGLAIYMTGLVPGIEAVSRLSMIWLGTVVYITFFLGLGTLLSTLFSSRWRSLATGIFLLLFFIGTPFITGIAADHIYEYNPGQQPAPGNPGIASGRAVSGGTAVERGIAVDRPSIDDGNSGPSREEIEAKKERFVSTVSRVSPSASYQNYVNTMIGEQNEEGLEPTFSESLSSSFGYIIYLISQTSLVLTAAYGVFLRQDL
ncbi:ABC transporter permease [Candidatus Nanohalovita haloferacivicina]|uniref:ABC transporter permease n=1 Tax=Candidatus Nanohalovita haloferacivicina TaxID=2978046 RepID=UPI00325FB545|nr:ABC-type multidrug transport system, permease component [Candidatus Nanohalobia archaeon BNXNv]